MRAFEIISNAPSDTTLPTRATKFSAGYDLRASEDIIIPSLSNRAGKTVTADYISGPLTLEQSAKIIKERCVKATLIPTGITYKGENTDFIDIRPRSSIATKNLLLIPNTPGTIDADYYPNEIKVPMINLSPYNIFIKKGERIAQAIIRTYETVSNEENIAEERSSGFGSTGKK